MERYTKQQIIWICTAIQFILDFQSFAAFHYFNILAFENFEYDRFIKQA